MRIPYKIEAVRVDGDSIEAIFSIEGSNVNQTMFFNIEHADVVKPGVVFYVDIAEKTKMKRTNFYYPEPMLDALKVISGSTGVPVSEHIRSAVDKYLKGLENDKRK